MESAPERRNYCNGYRQRTRDTRADTVALKVSKIRRELLPEPVPTVTGHAPTAFSGRFARSATPIGGKIPRPH